MKVLPEECELACADVFVSYAGKGNHWEHHSSRRFCSAFSPRPPKKTGTAFGRRSVKRHRPGAPVLSLSSKPLGKKRPLPWPFLASWGLGAERREPNKALKPLIRACLGTLPPPSPAAPHDCFDRQGMRNGISPRKTIHPIWCPRESLKSVHSANTRTRKVILCLSQQVILEKSRVPRHP